MEPRTYSEHYRIARQYDGAPLEIGRSGPAISYKGSDLRSGAPVVLTLVPVSSVDPEIRKDFEEQARAALQLDHINIAKVVAFDTKDDEYALISELPQGQTVDSWIAAHGPMSADAVLRVALQVISALGAASFYGLLHRSIQPSNLMIVPGQTVEGGWPFVKLMNFGLAGLRPSGERNGSETLVTEFASPEQVDQRPFDFRSEIYSLGATMCFLLTGVFYSAEPRSLQTRRFARPLRHLITPMLRQDPEHRPQDPMLVAQALRKCLVQVERRQQLASKFGIPFAAVATRRLRRVRRPEQPPVFLEQALVAEAPLPTDEPVRVEDSAPAAPPPIDPPRPIEEGFLAREPVSVPVVVEHPRPRYGRRALALAALLLGLAALGALLLPTPVSMIFHRNRDKEAIGVPVGVTDASTAPVAQNPINRNAAAAAPVVAQGSALKNAPVQSPPPVANNSPPSAVGTAARPEAPVTTQSNSAPALAAGPALASAPPAVVSNATVAPVTQHSAAPAAPPLVVASAPKSSPSASEPAPPAAGPQDTKSDGALSTENTSESSEQDVAKQSDLANPDALDESVPKAEKETARTASKYRSKTKTVTSTTRRSGVTKPRMSEGLDGDLSSSREHTVRARYVGMTPNGDLILRFPNGETAFVSPRAARLTVPPRHRVRRVIERRIYVPQPPPYGLMYPPDD